MTEEKPVHIYYHMDFDGLVSSALAHHFFRQEGFSPEIEKPVDFDIGHSWKREEINVKHPLVIVDFLYRKDAFAYFDHHITNKPFEISPETRYSLFDENAKSCASLIYTNLRNKNVDVNRFTDLVRWCDIIDSISYLQNNISIKDQLYSKEPAIILSKCLDIARIEDKSRFWNFLAERLIKNPSIEEICKDKEVIWRYERSMKKQKEALHLLDENSKYDETSGIVTYDATKSKWSRFGLASIYPDSLIWIGLIRTKKDFDISICQNPWNPKSQEALQEIHIGNILNQYCRGGGHKHVGRANIISHSEAKKSIKIITRHIKDNLR